MKSYSLHTQYYGHELLENTRGSCQSNGISVYWYSCMWHIKAFPYHFHLQLPASIPCSNQEWKSKWLFLTKSRYHQSGVGGKPVVQWYYSKLGRWHNLCPLPFFITTTMGKLQGDHNLSTISASNITWIDYSTNSLWMGVLYSFNFTGGWSPESLFILKVWILSSSLSELAHLGFW